MAHRARAGGVMARGRGQPGGRAYLVMHEELAIDIDRLASIYATDTITTIRRLAADGRGAGGKLPRLTKATVRRYARAGFPSDRTSRLRVTGRMLGALTATISAPAAERRRVTIALPSSFLPRLAGLSKRRSFLGLTREDFSRLGRQGALNTPLRVRKAGRGRRP